jgi:uncharacterized cupin superfamily protein
LAKFFSQTGCSPVLAANISLSSRRRQGFSGQGCPGAVTRQAGTDPLKPSIVNINTRGLVFSEWGFDKGQASLTTLVQPLAEQKLACRLVVVPPGNVCSPYHFQFANEEIYVILDGEGVMRHGERDYPVRAGDVISAPPEPAAKQQLRNTGSVELRYLAICNVEQPDVLAVPEELLPAAAIAAAASVEVESAAQAEDESKPDVEASSTADIEPVTGQDAPVASDDSARTPTPA